MPTDTRRIKGPETSQSPYDFCERLSVNLDTLEKNRGDGRTAAQFRPVFVRAGMITQARGSAYMEMNKTKVMCAVYGPREVARREDFSMQGQLLCDFKFATFSCQTRRQHQQDHQEKDLSEQMLEALEPAICLHKYPKAQINIHVCVLENDGGALCAAIMCASLALATAGIEMYDLVVASSVALIGNSTIIADPTAVEEDAVINRITAKKTEKPSGCISVAYLPSLNQVSAISSDGEIEFDTINVAIKECVFNCQRVFLVIQQTLTQHLQKTSDTKQ